MYNEALTCSSLHCPSSRCTLCDRSFRALRLLLLRACASPLSPFSIDFATRPSTVAASPKTCFLVFCWDLWAAWSACSRSCGGGCRW